MKMKTLLIFTLLGLFLESGAQDYSLLAGGRSEGLAHTSVTLNDAFATFHNPSRLAWNDHHQLGLSVRNHFNVSSMNTAYLSGAFHLFNGNSGVMLQYNGNNTYNDARFGFYYARPFGVIAPSLSFNVYQHYVQGFDVDYALTGDFGLTANFDELIIGLSWTNFTQSSWNSGFEDPLASLVRLGATYHFNEAFFLCVEGISELDGGSGFRAGLEYTIDEIVAIRAGYSSMPELVAAGLSLYLNDFTIDLAVSWHSRLGYSPQVAALYDW